MELSLVVAILPTLELDAVEKMLGRMGVRGVTVSKAKGYGAYANFYAQDWMVEQAKIEIFVERRRAESVAQAIIEVAHTGFPGDGIVAILPVEKVFSVRTRAEAIPNSVVDPSGNSTT